MFDTIVLLTGMVEQPVFSALLLEHNPLLTIISVLTAADLLDVDPELFKRARLIAYTTPIIVPQSILAQLRYGAYNFHPGPPEYPGWAPAHFALYDRAPTFGATVHVMVEKVDAGPIVHVERFDVPELKTVAALEERTYTHLAQLFWRMAKTLATQAEPLAELPVRWGARKNTRRGYAAVCDIPLDISKEELDRRIAVFGGNDFGMAPTVTLHGVEFQAVQRKLQQA